MKRLLQLFVAFAVASAATFAVAQEREWRITPYAWIAGFDGTVGTFGGRAGLPGRIDVDTGSLSDNMELGGAMLNLGWRRGPWSAVGDWTYANVKTDEPTPFTVLYAGIDVKVKGNIVEGNVGYDLLGHKDTHLDLFGGVRYYNLEAQLGLRENVLPGVLLTEKADWVDGVVGVRFATVFGGNWEAFGSADVGYGGSDSSWQLYGGIGYRFGWGSIVGGWRHLNVDYAKDNFKIDAALSGPFIGASFFF